VSSDAEEQAYPVDLVISYENRDGDEVSSAAETIGIPVGGKIIFTSGTVQVCRIGRCGPGPLYEQRNCYSL